MSKVRVEKMGLIYSITSTINGVCGRDNPKYAGKFSFNYNGKNEIPIPVDTPVEIHLDDGSCEKTDKIEGARTKVQYRVGKFNPATPSTNITNVQVVEYAGYMGDSEDNDMQALGELADAIEELTERSIDPEVKVHFRGNDYTDPMDVLNLYKHLREGKA